ncbi:hypothetical protein [Paenibacillus roseipurpureus]|uniref:Uncharacterized protein n=1 Tax=Paenibacillus roseopurpureus TaxID=2918901 RepID=A0AA96LRV5_9BACL|nr:hypothetical protein [Paenibacillus sp. MBLB1832]WNR45416.1 hypothetical protein MJB10_04580 [Paenibacillus sp. MBLB1832]
MLRIDKQTGLLTIENEKMGFTLELGEHLALHEVKHHAIPAREALSAAQRELFVMEVEGGHSLPASGWQVGQVDMVSDLTEEMISVELRTELAQNQLCAKVIFLHHMEERSIRFLLQFAAEWDEWGPREVYMRMPFLAELQLADGEDNHYFFPSNPQSKRDGSSIMQMHVEFTMPLGIFHPNQQHGFSLAFPNLNENWFIWVQNRNMDMKPWTKLEELQQHRFLLRPDQVLADVMEIKFTAIDQGWTEFFSTWRQEARQPINFEEYKRPELQWYRDTFLQHFTYLYSKEIYNFETNEMEVDRFLAEGEEFGGYDSVLLWHQYPRLGVDRRNQWQFFEDFPGGMAGLKELVAQFHSRGVNVFLPFKPWDIGFDESPKQSTFSIVEVVRETDIDGVFLDTMDSVPDGFREAINEVKPSFVFCSEVRPKKRNQIKLITGSWNQFKNRESMPEVDAFRYVMTEHFSPIISRWHVGVRKDLLIKRAVFNGTGILIWQDVFGSWLPYNAAQKAQIKKWKQLWTVHKANYQGSKPLPLYPTLQAGLHCNMFPSDDGASVIYTLYNDTDEAIAGELVVHSYPDLQEISELWQEQPVQLDKETGRVSGEVKPKELVVIRVGKSTPV